MYECGCVISDDNYAGMPYHKEWTHAVLKSVWCTVCWTRPPF